MNLLRRQFPQILEDRPHPVAPELRNLWTAVLNQAVRDLNGVPDWRDKYSVYARPLRREQAAAWFDSANRNVGSFLWICDTLMLDASGIRARVFGEGVRVAGFRRSTFREEHLQSPFAEKAVDPGQRAVLQV